MPGERFIKRETQELCFQCKTEKQYLKSLSPSLHPPISLSHACHQPLVNFVFYHLTTIVLCSVDIWWSCKLSIVPEGAVPLSEESLGSCLAWRVIPGTGHWGEGVNFRPRGGVWGLKGDEKILEAASAFPGSLRGLRTGQCSEKHKAPLTSELLEVLSAHFLSLSPSGWGTLWGVTAMGTKKRSVLRVELSPP